MFDPALLDPLRLDHVVASLARESSVEPAPDDELSPFAQGADFAARKSTFDALASLSVDPLLAAARDWVGHLCVRRVTWNDTVAVAAAFRGAGEASLHDRVGALLATYPDLPHVGARAASMVDAARRVSPLVLRLVERRLEAERLLGDAAFLAVRASRRALARALADEAGRAFASLGERPDWLGALGRALGRDAGEGWPARIGRRWLADLFKGTPALEGAALPPIALPPALGATSFALALRRFGEAFAFVDRDPKLPFVLARAPLDPRPARGGVLVSSLLLEPAFHVRVLGLGHERARDQARAVGRAFAESLRFAVLAATASATETTRYPEIEDAYASRASELFDEPLPGALALGFPLARETTADGLAALVEGTAWAASMRERFDDDWFHNPSAWVALRHDLHAPAEASRPVADADVAALCQSMREIVLAWV